MLKNLTISLILLENNNFTFCQVFATIQNFSPKFSIARDLSSHLFCMLLLFGALRNVSFNDNNHILRFFTEGSENLPSSFFQFLKSVIKYWAVHVAAFVLPIQEISFRHSQ